MALMAGGICWISPVRSRAAAWTAARVTPLAGAPAMTLPSASQVSVAWPSLIVARYSFSVRARCPSSRVALPTPTTSTPVASGSSVPAWPTRLVPVRRRSFATTSWEVHPAGLSMMSSPSAVWVAGRLRAFPRRGQGLVRGAGLGHQFFHVARAFGQGVADELKRRRVAQPGLPPHLGPDQPGRALQRRRGARLLLGRPVHRVVDRCLAQVVGYPGVGDRDEAEPGVLHPAFQHLGNDLGDPVGQLARPRRVVHDPLTPPRSPGGTGPKAARCPAAPRPGVRRRRAPRSRARPWTPPPPRRSRPGGAAACCRSRLPPRRGGAGAPPR